MFKIFNFRNVTGNYDLSNKNKGVQNQSFKNYTNLAPLQVDTLSFTSRAKKEQTKALSMPEVATRVSSTEAKSLTERARTITSSLANKLHQEAENDCVQLQRVLDKALLPLKARNNTPCDAKHPIYAIEYRAKSANSIREKASQKFLYKKESVIKNVHDLIGARIILGTSDPKGVNSVIDKLINCAKEGKIKITEIENLAPANKKYQYVSQTKLHQLAQASFDRFGICVPEMNTIRDSGYTAVHLLVEFPDGITGEIQILGKNVAIFKELEDISYKIIQGKSTDSKYTEIKEILSSISLPLVANSSNPANIEKAKLRKEFVAYATAAYKFERDKELQSIVDDFPIHSFLTLYEFSKLYGKRIHLDPKMDFNYLYRLKLYADNNNKT